MWFVRSVSGQGNGVSADVYRDLAVMLVADAEFAELVRTTGEAALSGYDLSDTERSTLVSLVTASVRARTDGDAAPASRQAQAGA